MKKRLKELDDTFAAAAFAEAGEFETAKQILKGRKKVLLTLTGRESDLKSFRYALNICKRIDAELEILHVSRSIGTLKLLKQFQDEPGAEKTGFRIIEGIGCLKEAIIGHTEKSPDIQFVVVESSEALNMDCTKNERVLSKAWKNLKCPLVLVSEASGA
ncbi:MAG: hypothetical protein C4526_10270 [Nitrospiraceae bacterium]|nr:MAG: hypothetical protein C4526_10270 [Nitrospiraceae bacterium]